MMDKLSYLKEKISIIKVRLTLWYIGILAVVLIIFSGLLYWNMEQYIYHRVENQLQVQSKKILQETKEDDNEDEVESYLVILSEEAKEITFNDTKIGFYDKTGTLILGEQKGNIMSKKINSPESNSVIKEKDNRTDEDWVIMTTKVKQGTKVKGWLRLAHPLKKEEATLNQLMKILFLILPLTLFLASIGGYFLASKALAPIDHVTKAAQDISYNNLSERINDKGVDDELGRLISTLNQLLDRLEEAFSREKRFTADASHELRTPITVIRAQAEKALKGEYSIEEYKHTLKIIQKQTSYMSHLVEQLLLLARNDMEEQLLEKEDLNLTELIEIVAEEMKEITANKEIELITEIEDGLRIHGDQSMLTQLFINLIDNAIKYTPVNGQITVIAKQQNDCIKIKVIDSGIGISQEDQEYIFNRFYRVDKSRSRASGGTGLGLAICQWIVKAHDGNISVESEVDKGSTFTICLPVDSKKGIDKNV